jgi:hypothetical protein
MLDFHEGRDLRSQASVDVESVWGQIKQNRYFRRFMLRGLPKVNAEWGLVALAHDMIKKQATLCRNQANRKGCDVQFIRRQVSFQFFGAP